MKTEKIVINFDLLVCHAISYLLLSLILLNINIVVREISGILYVLFIPGYMFVLVLFPRRTMPGYVRGVMAFGTSLLLTWFYSLFLMLSGLNVNLGYLSGIFTAHLLLFTIIVIMQRRKFSDHYAPWIDIKTVAEKINKIRIKLEISSILNILLVIFVGVIIILASTIILAPRNGERYTEFYLLNGSGSHDSYDDSVVSGGEVNLTLGIVNHEGEKIRYDVLIFQINSTINNGTIINNKMLYIGQINTTLDHVDIDLNGDFVKQWEERISVRPTEVGNYKLLFVLYKNNDSLDNFFTVGNNYSDTAIGLNIMTVVLTNKNQSLTIPITVLGNPE